MEARKVQKVGASSLSISLPKSWSENFQIQRGDVLFWDEAANGTLQLLPPQIARASKDRLNLLYRIRVDGLVDEEDILGKLVVGNYVLGRNFIVFYSRRGFSSSQQREIHQAVRRLMGINIVEETTHEIKIQCAVDVEQYSINQLVKRLFKIIKRMFLTALEALKTIDCDAANTVVEIEDEADRLYWLLLRLILSAQADSSLAEKIGIRGTLELIGNRSLVKYLEAVGDHAERIAQEIFVIAETAPNEKIEPRVYNRIETLGRTVLSLLEDAVSSIVNRDLIMANRAINYRREVKQKENDLNNELACMSNECVPEMASVIHAIAWNITWMGEYGTGIAEIAINRYLEQPSRVCRAEEI